MRCLPVKEDGHIGQFLPAALQARPTSVRKELAEPLIGCTEERTRSTRTQAGATEAYAAPTGARSVHPRFLPILGCIRSWLGRLARCSQTRGTAIENP